MADVSILSREEIARQADAAAKTYAAALPGAPEPQCPFPYGSDAAAAWHASFTRQLLWYTAPDAQASA